MQQDIKVAFSSKKYPLEVYVYAVSDWDGFDKLIQFMKTEYSVEIIECIDGPDARRCILKSEEKVFELRYDDPYGNSLVAISESSVEIVRKIGKDLEGRLKKR